MTTASKLLSASGGGPAEPGLDVEDVFSTYVYDGVSGHNYPDAQTAGITATQDQSGPMIAWYFTLTAELGSRSSVRSYYDGTSPNLYSSGGGGSGSGGHSYAVRGGVHYETANGTFVSLDDTDSSGTAQEQFGEAFTFAIGDVEDIVEIADQNLADFSGTTTIQSGDLIILYEFDAQNLSQGTLPTGFTEISYYGVSATNQGASHRLAVKIADGTENGTNYGRNWGLSGGFPSTRGIVIRAGTGTFNTASQMQASVLKRTNDVGVWQKIDNGLDLETDGGLVWTKRKSTAVVGQMWHNLQDTERGATKSIFTNVNNAETTLSTSLVTFTKTGYTIGQDSNFNYRDQSEIPSNYVSWSFKKEPKFFDCVTYTGTGSTQTISHNLNGPVGCIFVKRLDSATDWSIWHREMAVGFGNDQYYLKFDNISLQQNTGEWNNTAPTSTVFTVGNSVRTNASGATYVAYLFAHNDGDASFGPTGDMDLIKCASFTGNGLNGQEVDVGFEPQWLLIKNRNQNTTWKMHDTMRGISAGGNDALLFADDASGETETTNFMRITPTGFIIENSNVGYNENGNTIVYIAIRRSTRSTINASREVFFPDLASSSLTKPAFRTFGDYPSDTAITFYRPGYDDGTNAYPEMFSRLTGSQGLQTPHNRTVNDRGTTARWDFMNGMYKASYTSDWGAWLWKRHYGFHDTVVYDGNSTAGRAIPHNLGVAPEMIWAKKMNGSPTQWVVYHSAIGPSKWLHLDNTDAAQNGTFMWNGTDPTESDFTVGSNDTNNISGNRYIAYLWASVEGISKVGSYTGNGTSQNIDCGFANGARFVLIKNVSTVDDWFVHDTARGIVTGNDPFLRLNSTLAEDATLDVIDPYSAGFTIAAGYSGWNTNGDTYIFYAVAA